MDAFRDPELAKKFNEQLQQVFKRELVLIHARNRREAEDFAYVRELKRDEWRYINTQEQIRGFRGLTVYCIGHYYEHPNSIDIRNLMMGRDFKLVIVPHWR